MKRIRSSFSVIENFLDIMTSHDQEEWLPKYKASVTGGKGSQVSLGQLFTIQHCDWNWSLCCRPVTTLKSSVNETPAAYLCNFGQITYFSGSHSPPRERAILYSQSFPLVSPPFSVSGPCLLAYDC